MQEIYIDRQMCDVGADTLVTLAIKSNLFVMIDKIESNRTYSISLPRTDRNMALFGDADLLGARTASPYMAHTCTYINDGVRLIDEGTAYLLGIDASGIKIAVIWGVKPTLATLLTGGMKLTDIKAQGAILPYTYQNTPNQYSSIADLESAGYLYPDIYDNIIIPEDMHHVDRYSIYAFAVSTYHTPNVPCVRVPWLLQKVTEQTGVGFSFPQSVQDVVNWLAVMISGDKVTEQSVSGVSLDGTFNGQTLITSSNGLDIKITTASLEFTKDDGTALSVNDVVNRVKAVSDTTAYVRVTGAVLSGSVQMTPNNIEVLSIYLNTPLYVHNITQGEYKSISRPIMSVGGQSVYKAQDLQRYAGQTKQVVLTYSGAVEISITASDVLRIYHIGVTHTIFNPQNVLPLAWQSGGTIGITYDLPDRMSVGMSYDIIANLPDVKVIDLIKHIAVITGCFVRSLESNPDTLEFVPISDVFSNPAIDWSGRLLSERTATADDVEFKFGDYAQVNEYKYKENDLLILDHDGTALIDNGQLPESAVVFQSVFSCAEKGIDRMRQYRVPFIELPNDWYDVYSGEKTAPSTDAEKLLQGTPNPTIVMLGTAHHIDYYSAFVYHNTRYDMQSVINNNYSGLYASLNDCKVIKERMLLSDIDVRELKEDTPIYLAKYGQKFAWVEIKRTAGATAEVTLIKLAQ